MKKDKTTNKLAFNLAEASRVIGVSKPTLMRMLKDGAVHHVRYGKRIFISQEAIELFLRGSE